MLVDANDIDYRFVAFLLRFPWGGFSLGLMYGKSIIFAASGYGYRMRLCARLPHRLPCSARGRDKGDRIDFGGNTDQLKQ